MDRRWFILFDTTTHEILIVSHGEGDPTINNVMIPEKANTAGSDYAEITDLMNTLNPLCLSTDISQVPDKTTYERLWQYYTYDSTNHQLVSKS